MSPKNDVILRNDMKQGLVFISYYFTSYAKNIYIWINFVSIISSHVKSFQLTAIFTKRARKNESVKGRKRGHKHWWMVPAEICINLVCDTKNEVIIATSSNVILRITYRNMYHSHAILKSAINPYERCSSALAQSRSTLAGGYGNY